MNKGFVLKARVIEDSWIAHASPVTREVFDLLVRKANHSDNEYSGFKLKRGQLFTSYAEIRNDLHWMVGYRKEMYSTDQIKKCMRNLTKERMTALTKAPRGVIVTICNYGKYQDFKYYEGTNEGTNEGTTKPPSITKSIKNKELSPPTPSQNPEIDTEGEKKREREIDLLTQVKQSGKIPDHDKQRFWDDFVSRIPELKNPRAYLRAMIDNYTPPARQANGSRNGNPTFEEMEVKQKIRDLESDIRAWKGAIRHYESTGHPELVEGDRMRLENAKRELATLTQADQG